MKKFRLLSHVAVVSASVSFASSSFALDAAYWLPAATDWAAFGLPDNWAIGSRDSGTHAVPGTGHSVVMDQNMKFDLNGGSYALGGLTGTGTGAHASYLMSVTNGVLTIDGSIADCTRFDVGDGATVILKSKTARYWGCYCGNDTVIVHAGGRYEERGNLQFQGYRGKVEAGGVFVHDPISYGPHPGMGTAQDFHIYGRFEAPNGLRRFGEWDAVYSSPGGSVTHFVHDGGELLLGGAVSRNTQATIPFSLKFEDGCTLIASNTVTFAANMDLVKVMENAAVTMDVVENATLDLAHVTLGEGAAITKTGLGKLILRDATASSLAVSEGVVEIQPDSVAPTTVSFAADTTLHLTVSGFRLDAVTAYDGMAFELDPSLIVAGAGIISSSNADFLAYAKGEIEGLLPDGFGTAIVGDAVKLTKTSDYMFDATKSSDLSDPTAWKGGIVPIGEDVIVGGEGTVAFTAGAPAFRSISVQAGATLSVSGGTEAEPVDIPAVALSYDARLLISDYALLTNTLTTVGDATTLPILEIETNAVVTAQTPGAQPLKCVFDHYSYHLADYGFRLKNVKLRWYGTIKAPIQDLCEQDTKMQSSLYLGYAAKDETSYIAVDCQGGTWLASCEWNSSAHARTPFLIAVPDNGGTVIPVGTLLFRDYMRETQPVTASSKNPEYNWSGICIGKANAWYTGNPAGVEYDVVFEGSRTQLNSQGVNHIGGGAHVTFRDGASWTYGNLAWNEDATPRGVALYEKATLTAESGAELEFCPSKATIDGGNGIQVVSSQHAAGSAVFTARNVTFSTLAWKGSSAGIAVIEDAKLTIGNDRDHLATALTNVNTGVFANLSAARLDGDLTVSAADVWRTRRSANYEWEHEVKIVPPLTGEGGLAVTNEMPSNLKQWGMTVVVTNGANTATGTARACETVTGPANLVFADGANWAGTVVANAGLSLTNLTDGAAAATVSFGSIAGAMPIRVWKTGGVIVANDKVNLTGTAAAFDFVAMDEPLVVGDTVELGLYPENAALPASTRHVEYSSVASETPGFVTLCAKRVRPGAMLLIR